MRSIRSSVRTQLILSWCVWTWYFFYSSACATAGLRTRAGRNHNIPRGRGIQAIPEETGESNRNNRKKDAAMVETENPSDQPSLAPSYSTQLSSHPPTTSPTELSAVEFRLLPFSILIHGSLTIEDEFKIRDELQNYLLDSFLEEREQKVEVTTGSMVLEMVQMIESYIPLVEADEGDSESNEGNLNRSLLYLRRRNGYQVGRHLQSASPTSTVSTLVEYQASVILRLEQEQKEDVIDDRLPALQDRQIEALENIEELQGYFLKFLALEHLVDVNVDTNIKDSEYKNEYYSEQDPVVLMAVQVAERPSKSLNSKETWKTIELILNSSITADTVDALNDIKNNDGISESKANLEDETEKQSMPCSSVIFDQSVSFSESKSKEKKFARKIAVSIVCVLMIFVGLGGIFFVWRKKKHQYNRKFLFFSRGKDFLSGEVVHHVIKITSDVDSDHHEGSIIKKKNDENKGMTEFNAASTSNNISFESRVLQSVKDNVNNPTIPATVNVCDFEATAKESSLKKSSFTFSRISFLQNPFTGKTQQQEKYQLKHECNNDEADSVAAKNNLYNMTSNDDDSMMGYSLSSLNRDRKNNEGQQDDYLSVEDLDSVSVASSESNMCNPVFAGIHNILERKSKTSNPVQYTSQTASGRKSRWSDQQDQPTSLLGDDTIENEQGESLMITSTFETEDAEGTSTYTNHEFRKGDMPYVISAFSFDGITTNDLKYGGKDEIMTTPNNKISVPFEEVRNASVVLPMRKTESNCEGAMVENAHVPDDASDAPSDERNIGRSATLASQYNSNNIRYTDAIINSKLLDNDPAVLEYLVKDTQDIIK